MKSGGTVVRTNLNGASGLSVNPLYRQLLERGIRYFLPKGRLEIVGSVDLTPPVRRVGLFIVLKDAAMAEQLVAASDLLSTEGRRAEGTPEAAKNHLWGHPAFSHDNRSVYTA